MTATPTEDRIYRLDPPSVLIPTLTDAESRLLNHRDPTAKASLANCVTCKGRKTFQWFADPVTRRDVVTYRCDCENQYLLYRWLLNCGIRKQYQRLGWDDLVVANEPPFAPVMETVFDFIDNVEWYTDSGHGLIFTGEKGNGKSLLSYLILKRLVDKGVTVHATTFSDMIQSFSEGWEDREQARWFDRTVRNAQVLYIDDLGREYKGKNQKAGVASVGERMLEAVIRSRVASDQTTLITTNLKGEEIEQGYGGHTMSLLTECCDIVTVPGTRDWRPERSRREKEEIALHVTRPIVLA